MHVKSTLESSKKAAVFSQIMNDDRPVGGPLLSHTDDQSSAFQYRGKTRQSNVREK